MAVLWPLGFVAFSVLLLWLLLVYLAAALPWLVAAVLLLCLAAVLASLARRRWMRRRLLRRSARLAADAPAAVARDLAQSRRYGELRETIAALPDHDRAAVRAALLEAGMASRLAVRALGEPRRWRRVDALDLLGFVADPATLYAVIEATRSDDAHVAHAAVEALAGYDDPRAFAALLDGLGRVPLPPSRVADIARRSRASGRIAALRAHADSDDPLARFWTAFLLGVVGSDAAVPPLIRLSGDDDANVRANAVEALGGWSGADAVAAIAARLDDPIWFVRAHAVRALGRARPRGGAERIAPLLRDPQWWVRSNAAGALEEYGRAALPILERMLEDPDRFARNKAAEVLVRLDWLDQRRADAAAHAFERARQR